MLHAPRPGLIYAFQLLGDRPGRWYGEPEALPEGSYQTGTINFNPGPNPSRTLGAGSKCATARYRTTACRHTCRATPRRRGEPPDVLHAAPVALDVRRWDLHLLRAGRP